jgi:hypothetical protein
MERMRRHSWLILIVIGLATLATAGAASVTSAASSRFAVEFLAFELTPFLALAAVARRLPWSVSLVAAIGFSALTLATFRDVRDSTSSTASIALIVLPIVLVLAVPVLLAVCEAVRLVRLRLAGETVALPGWRDLALAVVLGSLGFVVLSVFGLVAGLALTFAIWAMRSGRTSRAQLQ